MPHKDNLLLASLSESDIELLLPHVKLMHVKQHQLLLEPGDKILTTYFPLTAIVFLVVLLSSGQSVEAAMVGRDGVVRLPLPLTENRGQPRCYSARWRAAGLRTRTS